MKAKRVVTLLSVVGTVVFVGLFVQTALRAQVAAGGHPAAVAAEAAPKKAATRLERLPCFGCHNIEHYRKGKPKAAAAAAGAPEGKPTEEFSHTLHQEENAGHCHVCHAFEGHFQVTIRKDARKGRESCGNCHD